MQGIAVHVLVWVGGTAGAYCKDPLPKGNAADCAFPLHLMLLDA